MRIGVCAQPLGSPPLRAEPFMASPLSISQLSSAAQILREAREAISHDVRQSITHASQGRHMHDVTQRSLDSAYQLYLLNSLQVAMREVQGELKELAVLASILQLGPSVHERAPADHSFLSRPPRQMRQSKADTVVVSGVSRLRRSLNDNKVLAFLQSSFFNGYKEALTQSQIAAGSDVPKGSISISLRRLKYMGLVVEPEHGRYILDTALRGAVSAEVL